MLDQKQFYINGEWVNPAIDNDFPVINPSNELACATISLGSQADTDKAVAAAKQAFVTWSLSSKAERISLVENILQSYVKRLDDMANAISTEMGAPIDMAINAQASAGNQNIESFLKIARDFEFVRPLSDDTPNDRLIYDPIGVCGLITPWNWPVNQIVLKVIPALLGGNTMVLKPSEISPLSGNLFAEIMNDAGTPAGVFNLINGDGPGVGTQLSAHPDIQMISFTGSTRAGIAISKNAADTLKRVHLELGGKGANIIFADADEKAVKRGAMHCFNNTGQSCNAPTRMLVQREIYSQAVETAKAAAESCRVNLASKSGKHIGPLVSELQFNKVQDLIQKGISEGATLVAGGLGRPEGLNLGYFVKPTVFADVNNQMSIAREEIFGPVLSMIPFDTEEEAIEISNDTPYGLTNYVQSQDLDRRRRVCRRLQSGMVEMNGYFRAPISPFGGVKASGNGREGGVLGLEDFMEVKSVSGWS
jgi:aldehyde dehydrogenase (NAD+)